MLDNDVYLSVVKHLIAVQSVRKETLFHGER